MKGKMVKKNGRNTFEPPSRIVCGSLLPRANWRTACGLNPTRHSKELASGARQKLDPSSLLDSAGKGAGVTGGVMGGMPTAMAAKKSWSVTRNCHRLQWPPVRGSAWGTNRSRCRWGCARRSRSTGARARNRHTSFPRAAPCRCCRCMPCRRSIHACHWQRSCSTAFGARCTADGGDCACSALAVPQDSIGGDAGGDDDLVREEAPAAPGAGDDAGGCSGALSVGVVDEGGAHAVAPCCAARSCLAASSSWPA